MLFRRVAFCALALVWLALAAPAAAAAPGPSPAPSTSASREPVVAPPPAAPHDHPGVRPLLTTAKAVGYLGLAVFVGGLAFLALLWPEGAWDRRVRQLMVAAWAAGTAAAVAGIALQGVYTAMRPLSDVTSPHVWGTVLDDHPGEVWAVKGLLWVLASVVLAWALRAGDRAVRRAPWRVAALAVAFGLVRTTGMTSHATGTARPFLSETADVLHLTGASLWFGGLVILLLGVLRRRRPEELAQVVPRYSMLALGCVLAIAASGLVLAWQLVGSVSGLLDTSYGRLLLAKLAIFALVLGAAQRSKRWVGGRLDLAVRRGGDAATVRPFVYSVAIETALLSVVLVAATLLVTAAPGR
ncbi:Copper transport protein YcnJ precursor [Actinomadura rubteroloni]|uniref:Copper transport protein YcnJ n=1 Tax=Actinomadura rubteroloni TaxID=1926885 RepID=A0A2P4UIC2_9ACTN|nr:CopD family protein [Actinomadura rubteroloni]POM24797.1 Copper transport protein YcnJ precursor [Actinomadura rubteroloni]